MYNFVLNHVAQYVELTASEKTLFTGLIKHRTLKKRQFLVQAGDVARYATFVNKGCLRAYYTTPQGGEYIIQFALEGWWIGDDESFLTGQPAVYNVEALEDCDLFQFDAASLEALYQAVPKFERFFRLLYQRSFIALQRRIIESMSKTAEERYLEFVTRYPAIQQRVPQYQLASYLGVTPEFLSKVRRQRSTRKP